MTDDADSLRAWLAEWGGYVARADLEAARPLFAPDVVGYGTRAEVATGIDQLVTEQWAHVWPAIRQFAFDVASARLYVSPDRRQAVIATTWTSVGPREDGSVGHRPGRATVVVARDDVSSPWRGLHTHFSLVPDAGVAGSGS